jgi:hypothetical protein
VTGVQTCALPISFERAWALPDVARAWLYRVAAPWLRGLYADRERRVIWLGVFSVASSLALTLLAPLWLLLLGPLLLGVPHLLADVRYLVVRPGLHLRPAAWVAAVPLALVGLGGPPVLGVAAMVPLVVTSTAPRVRRLLVLAACGVLAWAAVAFERAFLLVFLHAHNVVALLLWWGVRGRRRATLVVPLLAVAGALGLLAGWGDALVTAADGWVAPLSGLSFEDFVNSSAPLDDGALAVHVVLSFAFLQSLHYGVWLRLLPDDARDRPAPRPFAASWRALVHELGLAPVVAFTVIGLFIAVWGAIDPAGARMGYLRLGAFHGYLELVVAAWLFTVARRPAR